MQLNTSLTREQARFSVWRHHGPYQDLTSGTSLGWHSNSRYYADFRAMDRLIETDKTVMIEMAVAELITFYTKGMPFIKISLCRDQRTFRTTGTTCIVCVFEITS